jgi:FKBP-type peptidyl-prolyl cis-trans isomerase FkpA
MLLLVVLLTACAAPKATPPKTTAIQSCPTAAIPSCPTTVAQVSADHGGMWDALRGDIQNKITFSPGNKCSLEGVKSTNAGGYTYEIVVTSQEHQNYYLVIYTINPGNTFADIQALPDSYTKPPLFIQLVAVDHELPGSDSIHTIMIDKGPLYFSCMAYDPTYDNRFADLGPVEVPIVHAYPIGPLDTTPPALTSNAVTTASGLTYEDLEVGDGAQAKTGDNVTVNFNGWLTDGTLYDSQLDSNYRFTIATWDVPSGVAEGMVGMRVNGTRLLFIPPELAFGASGLASVIPANATLIIEVQLVAIK